VLLHVKGFNERLSKRVFQPGSVTDSGLEQTGCHISDIMTKCLRGGDLRDRKCVFVPFHMTDSECVQFSSSCAGGSSESPVRAGNCGKCPTCSGIPVIAVKPSLDYIGLVLEVMRDWRHAMAFTFSTLFNEFQLFHIFHSHQFIHEDILSGNSSTSCSIPLISEIRLRSPATSTALDFIRAVRLRLLSPTLCNMLILSSF